MDWSSLTAYEIASMVRAKTVSCEEVVRGTLERLHSIEPQLRSFITICEEAALDDARALDRRLSSGEDCGPLCGTPVAIKDNLCTRRVETTCGSRILQGFKPPYSATAVERLQKAGAIVIGKTNMDEFAMGSSTEYSAFFPTRNPWDTVRVPGGSSGGSAAAVAAGQAPIALGSDTGGSVRQPASFCGVVGLKPTYGRVSRSGLVAYASSLDQIGPVARSVQDAALLLGVIAGADPLDSTCATRPVPDYMASLRDGVKGLRIGLPREMFGQGVTPEVDERVRDAVRVLADAGASVKEISLPTLLYTLPIYYVLAPAEASSNLARYDGVEYGWRAPEARDVVGMYMSTRDKAFGPEVKQRILIGTYALSAGYYDAYYLKAQKVRTLVRQEFDQAFQECDILAGPTCPTPAFRIGEKSGDPMAMKLADVMTVPANIAGIPALSVPCGLAGGLPVGLQLMGRVFDEETLLRCAYTYEQSTPFHLQRPGIAA
ncbi:MAG: Asp-tRNA(Asn)/Glu-tRNA(Gln) amidotransferase subunit GatA [Chloroflexi bacterium]|nr:Asp-tRNA(Asn)/Glu-tRNA(Gln) amidotransferase subunit GatA [Chloroflexota bacterium]